MLIVWHSCLFDAHQVSVPINIYLSLRLSNYVLISNPMILHTQVAVIYLPIERSWALHNYAWCQFIQLVQVSSHLVGRNHLLFAYAVVCLIVKHSFENCYNPLIYTLFKYK